MCDSNSEHADGARLRGLTECPRRGQKYDERYGYGISLAIDRLEDDPKPGSHCHHPSLISPRVQENQSQAG